MAYTHTQTHASTLHFYDVPQYLLGPGVEIGVQGRMLSTVNWTIYSCCKHLHSSSCLSCSTVWSTLALGAHQTKPDKSCSTPAESLIKTGLPSQSDTFYKLLTALCSPLLPIQL